MRVCVWKGIVVVFAAMALAACGGNDGSGGTDLSGEPGELIGFGPIRVGDTWVEHRHLDPDYIGMCHTFTSLDQAEFQFGDMNESVSIDYEIDGGELWFWTAVEGEWGDQKAILLQTGTNQIDVRRVWYEYGNIIVDDDDPNRYWKKMACPH